jgi:transcriptional antiterminator RfaH
MNKEVIGSEPCWYALQTKPRQDERAESNLKAWRVETFAPKILERQYCRYTGKTKNLIKPLFPSYIFARFIPEEMLHKVRFTRGVHKILSTGGLPTPVDDEIIQIIRSRQGDDGLISIGEKLRPGDKVVVREGPLRDFIGIFEGNYNDEKRVSILLTTVSYQTRFVVAREAVKRVGEHMHS